jgi:hypothetical protein
MTEKKRIVIDQYEFVPHGATHIIRGLDYDTGEPFQSQELIDYVPESGKLPESKDHVYELLYAKGEPSDPESINATDLAPEAKVESSSDSDSDSTNTVGNVSGDSSTTDVADETKTETGSE